MLRWLAGKIPAKEQLLANRWVLPFAHRLAHPMLWQVNRRSIARGVALGLFAEFLIPLGQTPAAALMALTVRANVLIASAATLVTNPITLPPIYFAAYQTGQSMLNGRIADLSNAGMFRSLMLGFAAPTAIGLLLFAFTASLLGYYIVCSVGVGRLSGAGAADPRNDLMPANDRFAFRRQ